MPLFWTRLICSALAVFFPAASASASIVFLSLDRNLNSSSQDQLLRAGQIYAIDASTIGTGATFDYSLESGFSALGGVSQSTIVFSPSVDITLDSQLIRRDTIVTQENGLISDEWSFSVTTESSPSAVAAISKRSGRTFVVFNAWVTQGGESFAPWSILELIGEELSLFLNLSQYGIGEEARIKAISVFPEESIYLLFEADLQLEGRLLSSSKVQRLDLTDGLWFEDSSLCIIGFGCIGNSVAALEFTQNLKTIFVSSFEGK